MPPPNVIPLPDGTEMGILYEDRVAMAVDKPPGWMLAPDDWVQTSRNLPRTLQLALQEREFWARSRNLKFLRYVHRLDAETSGVLLLAKSAGAVTALSDLFESRSVEKNYVAVLRGAPSQAEWVCQMGLGPDPRMEGRMRVDNREGNEAETRFRVLQTVRDRTLVLAQPLTGRTHQIRVHALEAGYPIIGDGLYGVEDTRGLALRAVALSYRCPFQKRQVRIRAPWDRWAKSFGFDPKGIDLRPIS
ncbi:MAG TPA: RluA family pseudouridine synthase [Verrucomicrobiae bacterium]|jgi:RluA family pseudouridine synthase|nr:RluA family pseudouridine synthase [Verrucomicrobiae bacterium]